MTIWARMRALEPLKANTGIKVPYILYCETGTNSLLVCNKLALYGYIVKSLAGGIRGYNGRYLQLKP